MKSSTIRRSALSKESMDVIENLANEQEIDYSQDNNQTGNYTPGEYYREVDSSSSDNKSQEIDLLWQTFKTSQFTTNSTFMHVLGGFILGVATTIIAMALFVMFVANSDNQFLQKSKIMSILGGRAQVQQEEDKVEDVAVMVKEQNIPADDVMEITADESEVAENTSVVSSENDVKSEKINKKENSKKSEKSKTLKTQTDVTTPVLTKKYIIKDGDTVEAIIKRNYGSYTPERAEAIMKANHLKDLDHISIDQELLLPIEK